MNPHVCIVGAGVSGLCSARYLKENGIKFTIFEATRYIGGTWRYDHRVGTDENGLRLHTSMYKNLRTNLAAPAMELRGFPVPKDMPAYPSWKVYYEYIQSYAKHFKLKEDIKFLHFVSSVTKNENKWTVQHNYIPSGEQFEEEYDYVLIACGHFSKPVWPYIPGANIFNGKIIHSHDYREPDVFKNRRVLLIGVGPSGLDIAIEIASVSRTLVHSHHFKHKTQTPFPPHYIMKPDIKELRENSVVFVDGSFEDIDDVVYCTGYEYNFPFLDASCELTRNPQYVTPLHKMIVNINQPTMMFIGLIKCACNVIAIDSQARYITALIKGDFSLPSQKEMIEELQKTMTQIKSEGRSISDIHFLGNSEDEYYAALTKESGIARVSPVMTNIRLIDFEKKLENLYTYREYVYTIVDDNNFTRHYDPYLSGSYETNL